MERLATGAASRKARYVGNLFLFFSFFSFFSFSYRGRGRLTPKEFSVMEIIPVTGVIPMIRFVHIPRGRGPGISFPREGKLFPTN